MSDCTCFFACTTQEQGACFSEEGLYRYSLWRTWDQAKPPLFVVMLNPSSADASENDPTITRVIGFAKKLGHGGLIVGNVFALVSTDPKVLREKTLHAVGPLNDDHLTHFANTSARVIAGWGANLGHPSLAFRAPRLREILSARLEALHVTKDGHPGHPLYLKSDSEPRPFTPA